MAIIVQKFGGLSLSCTESIKRVISFVACELKKNNKVVVVVSAMYGFTDKLYSYARELSSLEHDSDLRECDSVLAAGEQISAGLFALALRSCGIESKSLLGWQVPVVTSSSYSNAFIQSICTEKIFSLLDGGVVPVITGFQGIEKDGNITTLQRGGSDTSAVAISVALKADRCDIYTNVDGVYTSDPSLVADAVRISSLSYQEMLEISLNARVLDSRSVEIAQNNFLPVRVLSSFQDDIQVCTQIGHFSSSDSQLFNAVNVSSSSRCSAAKILSSNASLLLKQNFPLKLLVASKEEIFAVYDLVFQSHFNNLVNRSNLDVQLFDDVVIVSLVGTKLHTKNADIFLQVADLLEKNYVPIINAVISEIKISIIVEYVFAEVAVKLLHGFVLKCAENVC